MLLGSLVTSTRDSLINNLYLNQIFENDLFKDKDPNYAKHTIINLTNYSSDEVEVEVELDGDAILVVTNSYSKYWKVFVDEIERNIVPAYHTFWGVSLSKEDKKIVFKYLPPYKLF